MGTIHYYIGKRKRVYEKSSFFIKYTQSKNIIQRKIKQTVSTHLLPNQKLINCKTFQNGKFIKKKNMSTMQKRIFTEKKLTNI